MHPGKHAFIIFLHILSFELFGASLQGFPNSAMTKIQGVDMKLLLYDNTLLNISFFL